MVNTQLVSSNNWYFLLDMSTSADTRSRVSTCVVDLTCNSNRELCKNAYLVHAIGNLDSHEFLGWRLELKAGNSQCCHLVILPSHCASELLVL